MKMATTHITVSAYLLYCAMLNIIWSYSFYLAPWLELVFNTQLHYICFGWCYKVKRGDLTSKKGGQ